MRVEILLKSGNIVYSEISKDFKPKELLNSFETAKNSTIKIIGNPVIMAYTWAIEAITIIEDT